MEVRSLIDLYAGSLQVAALNVLQSVTIGEAMKFAVVVPAASTVPGCRRRREVLLLDAVPD